MISSFFRRVAGMLLRLPKPTSKMKVERNITIKMRDGVELFAHVFTPATGAAHHTVLMRSPYGRGPLVTFSASLLAERGLTVVVQSVRGTSGSGGTFDPVRQERDDGLDTVAWIRAQPWFGGKLFLFGGSYLGIVIWAIACEAPDKVDGAAITVTPSNISENILEGGGFAQGTWMGWSQMMKTVHTVKASGNPAAMTKLDQFQMHLPLGSMDQQAMGGTASWWQDWLRHGDNGNDSYWQAMDFSAGVTALRSPVYMVTGWQDLFLPQQLRDFEARQAAGLDTWLLVGPWSHGGPGGLFGMQKACFAFLAALNTGDAPLRGQGRVRIYVQGAKEWRDYPSWPPPDLKPVTLHLRVGGRLDVAAPAGDEGAVRYVYDPADPTPGIYGPTTTPGKTRDMSALERRTDVVSFTSAPLDAALEVIGPVSVELAVRSDRDHTDFYVCLCDVDAKGRPIHVADGYLRLRPGLPLADASGVRRISIDCWPTAYRFRQGDRLRLLVASGAFPRYARNLGTGEPLATGVAMLSAQQEILLGAAYNPAIRLFKSPVAK
jgi:putative CocE/NonD family hydrolase